MPHIINDFEILIDFKIND